MDRADGASPGARCGTRRPWSGGERRKCEDDPDDTEEEDASQRPGPERQVHRVRPGWAPDVRPGAEADPDDLRATAGRSLARYKLPKQIVFRPQVRRSPAGKADYAWARAQTDPDTIGDPIHPETRR